MSARSARTASTASGGSASTYVTAMPGCARAERRRCSRGTSVGDAEGNADEPHPPGAQPPELGELAGRGIERRRHGGRVAGEHAPRLGEADAAADPLDERDAECAARTACSCWLTAGWL